MVGIQTSSSGAMEQIDINLDLNKEAESSGARHVMAYLDDKVRVDAGMPTPRQQVYAQLHLNRKDARIEDVINGKFLAQEGNGGPLTVNNQITGRLALQSWLMDTVEATLRDSDYGIMGLFNSHAAEVQSIPATKFDRPIITYQKNDNGKAIAQLSEPTRMLTLTASDASYKIPGESIGIEYSDQAAQAFSVNLVQLSLQRQAEEAAVARVEEALRSFYNGDPDIGMESLATAGLVVNHKDLDNTAATNTLTQKAWMLWLFQNNRKRTINTVITDIEGAMAIEARTGKPTVMGDESSRVTINSMATIANPAWPNSVEIILTQDPAWPSGVLVGFDKRYGYEHVISTTISYSATESYAIRRSTKLRIDAGSTSFRLFDDSWSALNIAD